MTVYRVTSLALAAALVHTTGPGTGAPAARLGTTENALKGMPEFHDASR